MTLKVSKGYISGGDGSLVETLVYNAAADTDAQAEAEASQSKPDSSKWKKVKDKAAKDGKKQVIWEKK